MRLDEFIEVLLVLNDSGDYQVFAGLFRDINSQMRPLIKMYASKEDQLIARRLSKGQIRKVNTVINRRQIVQPFVPVRIADGSIVRIFMVVIDP